MKTLVLNLQIFLKGKQFNPYRTKKEQNKFTYVLIDN